MCRDNGITVLDAQGTDLTSSVMGGVNGMLAEMDRDATVARLAAGKKHWRGQKRVEGRWPYGEHPSHEYDSERAVVTRIQNMRASGVSSYAIARTLNAEGTRTRYGKEFTTTTVQNILRRSRPSGRGASATDVQWRPGAIPKRTQGKRRFRLSSRIPSAAILALRGEAAGPPPGGHTRLKLIDQNFAFFHRK